MDRKQAILSEITSARESLVELAGELSEADLARPTRNEGWTVKDTLAHAVASEAGLRLTAERILRGETTAAPGPSLAERNAAAIQKRKDKSLLELLKEAAAARQQTLALLEGLTPDQLDVAGHMASGREATVDWIIVHIGEHEAQHAEDIRLALGQ
ncbi:MAG: DinB family protein [Chloroflexi bacterium]|nr:DinB family protein [Chloroflexota bacterium]